jgi:predicted nuclease of restriction endonuclease-like RecB superfamily
MLTKDLAVANLDFHRFRIEPDRLTQQKHGHYLAVVEAMLRVYQTGTGLRRRDLHRRIQNLFTEIPDCPPRRIDAFCKLLDDQSVYDDSGRKKAPALRREVFGRAAAHHPLVQTADTLFDSTISGVQQKISAELGKPWHEIEDQLFADVIEFHRLKEFPGYPDARAFLSRYNVAQVQVALFSAVSMQLRVSANFKQILRAIRLAQLMHSITRISDSVFDIQIDGPASVLRETRRYGVQMARFLPALVASSGWSLEARIAVSGRLRMTLELRDTDRLRSNISPETEFDSTIEQEFSEKWGTDPREGWTLFRESEFLFAGQKTFVPDFVFHHVTGVKVYFEIVGFWTPEYLQARQKTMLTFSEYPVMIAVHHLAQHLFTDLTASHRVITYKTTLTVKPVVETLNSYLPAS